MARIAKIKQVDEISEYRDHGDWHPASGKPVVFDLDANHPMETLHRCGSITQGWTYHHWNWDWGFPEDADIIAWRFYDKDKREARLKAERLQKAGVPLPSLPAPFPASSSPLPGWDTGYEAGWNEAIQEASNLSAHPDLMPRIIELISYARSVNRSRFHTMKKDVDDDKPVFWQRKEWIEGLLQICDEAEAIIEGAVLAEVSNDG